MKSPSPSILAELPIFPLPDVVLFPGTVLPLHVFEPRYVQMIRDVMAGERMLGIVGLSDRSGPVVDPPPIHEVATVGQVIATQDLPGDRIAILVRGIERIRVEDELPPNHPYRQVRATLLPSREPDADAGPQAATSPVAVDDLLSMCDQLSQSLGEAGTQLREALHAASSPSELADLLAAALITEPARRQEMLEQLNPSQRLHCLFDQVSQLIVDLAPPSSLRN
jgi:Lon protease-like protein